MSRRVVQFSCGAASAVAAKLTVSKGGSVAVINAFLKEEHEDNRRFLTDVERWIGVPIVQLRDEKYGASARDGSSAAPENHQRVRADEPAGMKIKRSTP